MNTQIEETNSLTCTSIYRTLYAVRRTVLEMDATQKKLVEKMQELQMWIAAYKQQANAISTALESIGMKVEDDGKFDPPHDVFYATDQPFRQGSLVAACKRILRDYDGQSLTKSQVEYLAAIGGFPFSTEDAKNSVDVTLRRLAERGFCEVERTRGPAGNQYRWVEERDDEEEGSNDAAATKGKRK